MGVTGEGEYEEILTDFKNGKITMAEVKQKTMKRRRAIIEPGTITYELFVAKYIKKDGRGWHTIDTSIVEESNELEPILEKLKVTPSRVKSAMETAEKEYFAKLKKKAKKKEAIKEDDPVEKLKKEIEEE